MSSIITNNSAMVALQTLKSINSGLAETQAQISTGKKISDASDNASVWAISKVMASDLSGFSSIADSLALGESTVAVARNATETVTELLTDLKSRIVLAQQENVDREKIQSDVEALRDQIHSVVATSQFNGLNLLNGNEEFDILSSFNRDKQGNVDSTFIRLESQNLTSIAGTFGSQEMTEVADKFSIDGALGGSTTLASDKAAVFEVTQGSGGSFEAGDAISISIGTESVTLTLDGTESEDDVRSKLIDAISDANIAGISATVSGSNGLALSNETQFESVDFTISSSLSGGGTFEATSLNGTAYTSSTGTIEQQAETIDFGQIRTDAGDGFEVRIGGGTYHYIARAGETARDVANGLKIAIDNDPQEGIKTKVQVNSETGAVSLAIDYDNATATNIDLAGSKGGKISGGLFGIDSIDVRTSEGAATALDNIEIMIQSSIDGSAALGSTETRMQSQSEFVSRLSDALKSGIGALVDADMEEASARLQALQVQQQLGIQALSIANQEPQNILALFR